MRRASKIDNNQTEIVEHLRMCGATVHILSAVGKGCPDLLVGWAGDNLLMEVKVGKGKLTKDQVKWHKMWGGCVHIVHNKMEASEVLLSYTF